MSATASPATADRAVGDDERYETRAATLDRLERLARLLDAAYRIPGTRWRFGLDAVLGLLPVLGDVASAALSGYMIVEAQRLGAPRQALAQMLANLVIDVTVGAIPVVGDVFDVFWRANTYNLRILRRHLAPVPSHPQHSRPQR